MEWTLAALMDGFAVSHQSKLIGLRIYIHVFDAVFRIIRLIMVTTISTLCWLVIVYLLFSLFIVS